MAEEEKKKPKPRKKRPWKPAKPKTFTNCYLTDIESDTANIPEGHYEGKRCGRECVIQVNGQPVKLESAGWVDGKDNPCIVVISKKSKPRAKIYSFFA